MFDTKLKMPAKDRALPGRAEQMPVPEKHHVNGAPLKGPFPDGMEQAMFGLGCFWGAEKKFWQIPGVYTTAVGYAAGYTPNPDVPRGVQRRHRALGSRARRVRSAQGHLFGSLKAFWESHDPTQGMRQGNDVGTQYRSGIYYFSDAQREIAERSRDAYQQQLQRAGYGTITTEILPAPEFYYAEDYHQQYLSKNPGGYCGLGGTGVSCPIGTEVKANM